MEANVWSDPQVLQRLRDEYVLVALFTDDRKKLPENEWVVSAYDGKTKKTLGKKWVDFQVTRYNSNSQPFYVQLDHNGELLVKPGKYDLDIGKFVEFLDQGIEKFKKSR